MGFWDALYGGLRELFWFAMRQLIGYGESLLGNVLDTLVGYVPESVGPSLSAFSDYIDIANAWVPIDIGLGLFLTWLTARLAVLSIRHIIKLIPTIG